MGEKRGWREKRGGGGEGEDERIRGRRGGEM